LGRDEVTERTGARDDEVSPAQGSLKIGQGKGATTRCGRQTLGLDQRPVDDDQLGRAEPAQALERPAGRRDVAEVVHGAKQGEDPEERGLGDHEVTEVGRQQVGD